MHLIRRCVCVCAAKQKSEEENCIHYYNVEAVTTADNVANSVLDFQGHLFTYYTKKRL